MFTDSLIFKSASFHLAFLLSFSTMSSATTSDSTTERLVHPFTAEWCSITACELMEEEIQKNPLSTQCTRCKNGLVTLTISHLGGKKDGQTYTTLMTCSSCDGKGTVSLEKARSHLFGKMVHCQCEKSPGSIHAKDGHQEFGNDTYLCTDCSMVTQFG